MNITIGPFLIVITPMGRLTIFHESGEGGEFSLPKFIEHIREFFDREF